MTPGPDELRLLLVPRWAGTPESDFYPWLREQLAGGPFAEVRTVPPPAAVPVSGPWVARLREEAGDAAALRRTILLAHSVGCQAVLRLLAGLPDGVEVRGVLCVAGWWTVDRPWDTLLPWLDPLPPADLAAIRRAAPRLSVLLSDNDPFTADHEDNRRRWRERLGAEVRLVPGAAHFNGAREPAVLEALLALVSTGGHADDAQRGG